MAREAHIIGTVRDSRGTLWDVRERRATAMGWDVCIGWISGVRKGRGGCGLQAIPTPELVAHLEANQSRGSVVDMVRDLHISHQTIGRLRKILGHDCAALIDQWWRERAEDLANLSGREFADRHGVSEARACQMRQELLGISRKRIDGWWGGEPYRSVLLSDLPTWEIARLLSLSESACRVLSAKIRRADGATNAEIEASGRERMSLMRSGVPAPPVTRAALLVAAKRPKSEAHREAIRAAHLRRLVERSVPIQPRKNARRLTVEQVAKIRADFAAGRSVREMAGEAGISKAVLYFIVRGQTYRDAPGETNRRVRQAIHITPDQVIFARAQYLAGAKSIREIASDLGCSAPHALNIMRGKLFKDLPGAVPAKRPRRLSAKDLADILAMRNAGMSHAQIGAQLNISYHAAAGRVKLAKRLLKPQGAGLRTGEGDMNRDKPRPNSN